jgi:hypothetical protein
MMVMSFVLFWELMMTFTTLYCEKKNENEEWEDANDWEPLFECGGCGGNTRGHVLCEECGLCRDGSAGNSSDEEQPITTMTTCVVQNIRPAL